MHACPKPSASAHARIHSLTSNAVHAAPQEQAAPHSVVPETCHGNAELALTALAGAPTSSKVPHISEVPDVRVHCSSPPATSARVHAEGLTGAAQQQSCPAVEAAERLAGTAPQPATASKPVGSYQQVVPVLFPQQGISCPPADVVAVSNVVTSHEQCGEMTALTQPWEEQQDHVFTLIPHEVPPMLVVENQGRPSEPEGLVAGPRNDLLGRTSQITTHSNAAEQRRVFPTYCPLNLHERVLC